MDPREDLIVIDLALAICLVWASGIAIGFGLGARWAPTGRRARGG